MPAANAGLCFTALLIIASLIRTSDSSRSCGQEQVEMNCRGQEQHVTSSVWVPGVLGRVHFLSEPCVWM